MPNPSIEELEREVFKRPQTDQQHQPDQSQHAQEIDRLLHPEQASPHEDQQFQSQG